MKTVLVVLVLLLAITMTSGEKEDAEEEKKACKKESRKTMKQILKHLTVCNAQMKNETKDKEEHSKKMGCVVKCILKLEAMLDEREMMTDMTIKRAIGNRATEARRKMTAKKFQECNSEIGSTLDPLDPLCLAYGKLGQCIQNAVIDVCEMPLET